MIINDLNDVTSTEGLSEEQLKDYAVNYLMKSGFVDALVKKTIYQDDIDNYYDDFRQETYLAILELKPGIWTTLYQSAKEKNVEFEYEIRNYISRVILNTCRSTSSNAYRKLKKPLTKEKLEDYVKWTYIKNTLEEPKDIFQQIIELN